MTCIGERSRRTDKACLEIVQAGRSLEGITVLGFEKIADGKGHHYLTIIHALEGPRGPECLMLVPGRKQKDLEPFWAWFGKERAKRITHGVMDMENCFFVLKKNPENGLFGTKNTPVKEAIRMFSDQKSLGGLFPHLVYVFARGSVNDIRIDKKMEE